MSIFDKYAMSFDSLKYDHTFANAVNMQYGVINDTL